MKKYTVVVLYPRRLRRELGPTYIALVEAKDVESALRAGALVAQRAQPNRDRGVLSDWRPLLAFRGHCPLVYTI